LKWAHELASKREIFRAVLFLLPLVPRRRAPGVSLFRRPLPVEAGKVIAMMNFDMVGRLGKEKKSLSPVQELLRKWSNFWPMFMFPTSFS
jgi:hypothetical protein